MEKMHDTRVTPRRLAVCLLPLALTLAVDSDGAGEHGTLLLAINPHALASLLLLGGGLLSGLLAGLLGIGGALVTLPVMYIALPGLGVEPALVPATAVSTALIAMLPTTLMAARQQHRRGVIEQAWLRRLAGPMALGAAGGACLAAVLNGPLLALLFAMQTCCYGWRLLRSAPGGDTGGLGRRLAHLPPWLAAPAMAAFCACVGMGGGSLVAPHLQRQGVPFRHAVATAGALNLCIAAGGSAAFSCIGGASHVAPCWLAASLLAAGALTAVPLGVAIAHRVPTRTLQRLIGVVSLVSACSLVMQVLR
jgi:uncharacterized membrane protein YfcA